MNLTFIQFIAVISCCLSFSQNALHRTFLRCTIPHKNNVPFRKNLGKRKCQKLVQGSDGFNKILYICFFCI